MLHHILNDLTKFFPWIMSFIWEWYWIYTVPLHYIRLSMRINIKCNRYCRCETLHENSKGLNSIEDHHFFPAPLVCCLKLTLVPLWAGVTYVVGFFGEGGGQGQKVFCFLAFVVFASFWSEMVVSFCNVGPECLAGSKLCSSCVLTN